MGVKVREYPKGSGDYYVFINHRGTRKSKKIGKDEELANEVAEKIKAKLVLGELDVEKINKSYPAFKKYAEMWLALPHDWKESTRESYQFNLKKHIYPVFGKKRIDEIRRKNIKAFFDKLLSNGMAAATASLVRAPLRGVLSHAVDSELIETNPVSGLKLARKKTGLEVDPLAEIEVESLLKQSKKFLNGFYYPMLLCSLRTGMRVGEIKALKWSDVDFEQRLIEVKRGCRQGRICQTKNKKRRRVDMTPHLTETLKTLRIEHKKNALKHGRPVPVWVFTNTRGKMLTRAVFENALKKCLDKSNLRKIRIHDLRHTYASIRLLRGHNVGDVSYQLGHSSIKITYDIYGHWIPGKFKSEVDELDHPPQSTLQNAENTCV